MIYRYKTSRHKRRSIPTERCYSLCPEVAKLLRWLRDWTICDDIVTIPFTDGAVKHFSISACLSKGLLDFEK